MCQSSAQGTRPCRRVVGETEFARAFLAPLALAAVSLSPSSSRGWSDASCTSAVSPVETGTCRVYSTTDIYHVITFGFIFEYDAKWHL